MQTRTATVDRTPIRWLEQGAGTPVVLVHGIPTSPALWRHGGGAAMARQVSALDVQDTLAVQDRLPALKVPARIVWGVADHPDVIAEEIRSLAAEVAAR